MVDYDAPEPGAPLDKAELRAALTAACPALADAPAVWPHGLGDHLGKLGGFARAGIADHHDDLVGFHGVKDLLPVFDHGQLPGIVPISGKLGHAGRRSVHGTRAGGNRGIARRPLKANPRILRFRIQDRFRTSGNQRLTHLPRTLRDHVMFPRSEYGIRKAHLRRTVPMSRRG